LAFINLANLSIIPAPTVRPANEARDMTNNIKLAVASCFVTMTLGCSLPRPLFAPPGPVRYQQNNASYHDPYPDPDAGPEIDGGRPRDFQIPSAEPVRSRVYTDRLQGR
jgi:hypothetical protein